jgi:integrase
MRWEDLELDTGWWTIPAHITKNGLSHRVPLNMPAQEMLQTVRMTTGNGQWVFPSRRHTGEPFVSLQKPMSRVREISGVSFVWHDLRRTAASHMTSMGIPRLVVSKILNHVEPGVTRVYNRHSYDAEKREALEMWGRKVMELVNRNP